MSQRPPDRPIPPAALELIRQCEGLRLSAYRDPVGIWTIGYGHTGPVDGRPLARGTTIAKPLAEALLLEDARSVAADILDATRVPLSDGEFGALVSFAFNLGFLKLRGSTLWKKLQAGDRRGAAGEFSRWTKAGRPLRELPGLVRRRAAERALFVSGVTHV